MASAERSAVALKAFRQIIQELRKTDKTFNTSSPQYKFLADQMLRHKTTQRVLSKGPTEMESVAQLYATYLSSTRRLLALQETYKGTEKTVEESANLVGLSLPKKEHSH
ncbi:unnamed protein product, partial [Mesorhabditis spiculigera]